MGQPPSRGNTHQRGGPGAMIQSDVIQYSPDVHPHNAIIIGACRRVAASRVGRIDGGAN